LLFGVLALACAAPENTDEEEDPFGWGGTDDTDTEETEVGAPSDVVLDDSSSGITITIVDSTAPGWLLGNIYPAADDYGEACRDASDVCHEIGADGGSLSYCETADEDCTAMAQLYWRTGSGSFILLPTVGLGCFVWGDDADYWSDLDCTVTAWSPSSY
jgi:hypothetical protein